MEGGREGGREGGGEGRGEGDGGGREGRGGGCGGREGRGGGGGGREGRGGVMVDVCGEMKMTLHTLHSGLSEATVHDVHKIADITSSCVQ